MAGRGRPGSGPQAEKRPRRRGEVRTAGSLVKMTMIAERPKETDDRRVRGH